MHCRSTAEGLPFFLPSRLVDFEYFEQDTPDEGYNKEAKDYETEIDFAFFVVNFGYTKADYEALTPREKIFIYKAWENKIVSDSSYMRNAFLNGYLNARRKRGKKFVDLWKKKQKRLNKEVAKENLTVIMGIEDQEGKSWVDFIYQKNGLKKGGVE